MPNRKNYPKWFSEYSEPSPPIEPEEFHTNHKIIESVETYNGGYVDLQGGKYYIKAFIDDGYIDSIELERVEEVKVRNSYFEKQQQKYLRDLEEWKVQAKEWRKLKKQWDEEAKAENEAQERAILEKLKAKYENCSNT